MKVQETQSRRDGERFESSFLAEACGGTGVLKNSFCTCVNRKMYLHFYFFIGPVVLYFSCPLGAVMLRYGCVSLWRLPAGKILTGGRRLFGFPRLPHLVPTLAPLVAFSRCYLCGRRRRARVLEWRELVCMRDMHMERGRCTGCYERAHGKRARRTCVVGAEAALLGAVPALGFCM